MDELDELLVLLAADELVVPPVAPSVRAEATEDPQHPAPRQQGLDVELQAAVVAVVVGVAKVVGAVVLAGFAVVGAHGDHCPMGARRDLVRSLCGPCDRRWVSRG